jgi:class 3 adenylate cyclase/tetratricopeptide (TPR) repeat protein
MSVSRQERKVVTALFCDLVGFTSQAEEMDPEDVASLLAPYHARVKEELERYGGTVEKFIGDAVMALFGAPVTHEDDPDRAVRAALAIRQFGIDAGLELRIGIATGEALVTLDARPDAGETMATGDVVNTAARLQTAAPVNGILVSEKTFQATGESISFRDAEAVLAKGKAQPVRAWEAVEARSDTAHERGHATEFVGRLRELELVRGALERVLAECEPQLVTLVGVPGIGKSRLVRELEGASTGITWLHGRCLPYGDGVTFWPLGEIVRRQLGVREGDSRAAVEAALGDAVSDEWIAGHLRPLLGLEVEGSRGDQTAEAYAAWRSFLEACAAQTPLAVVFEDLHWADDALLDFVDHLVEWSTGVPLLVVATTRPELLEQRPAWGGGKTNATTISLAPLSDEETGALVASLVGRAVVEAEIRSALLVRAGGNPLYAEQFALLVQDHVDGIQVPETVQGLIAARIDLLSPQQKVHLQDASVVGRAFWLDASAAISGVDRRTVEVELHALERKGFIRRERATSLSGQTEYTFQHLLVGDVAYGQIPRVARSEKHRLAAEWIASAASPEETAELRAHHYGAALSLARAARLETTALEEPARIAFRDAADRAFDLSAYRPAARLYEQALELWPGTDHERPALLLRRARAVQAGIDDSDVVPFEEAYQALLEAGELDAAAEAQSLGALSLRSAGRGADALERAHSATTLLADRREGRAKTYVIANYARLLAVLALEYDEATRTAEIALAAARRLGLRDLEAHCLNTIGVARIGLWDVGGVSDLEESLRIGREHCSAFEILRIYNNLISCYDNAGLLAKSDATLQEASAFAERLGATPLIGFVDMLAGSDFGAGRWQEAWDRIASVNDHDPESSDSEWAAFFASEMLWARDELDRALAVCDRALGILRASQPDADVALALQVLLCQRAVVAQAANRDDERVEAVREIREFKLDPRLMYPSGVPLLTLMYVELELFDLASSMQVDGPLPWHEVSQAIADGRLVEAADRLERIGDLSFAARVRLSALRQLASEGRGDDIDELLPKVLAFYRSVDAPRFVREAEELRASVA